MLGATGDVGRQVCSQLIERRVLPPTSRLQLVGRRGGGSERAAHGLRADLIDAYDEHAPLIDVALDPADVVVSNPVELGVRVLADALGRHRVIGMGAWLDTLRFRREIAVSSGLRRHRIGGFVGGAHGPDLVPLWSTVRISGLDPAERRAVVDRLRGARSLDGFDAEIARAQRELLSLDIAAA